MCDRKSIKYFEKTTFLKAFFVEGKKRNKKRKSAICSTPS